MKKTLIIFDLDGTLVNAYPAVVLSVNETLKTLGFKPRSALAIKRAVGMGDRQLLAQFVGDGLAGAALEIYRPHHEQALLHHVRWLPTVLPTIKKLKASRMRLAIATNRPSQFTRLILSELDAHKYFDIVLCADQVANPKPYPDMIHKINEEMKVHQSEVCYVGDMTIDVHTGQQAGVETIAVSTGSSTIKELKALKPKAIISKMSQILTLIREDKK